MITMLILALTLILLGGLLIVHAPYIQDVVGYVMFIDGILLFISLMIASERDQ